MGKKTVVTAKEAEPQTKKWVNKKKSAREMEVVNTTGNYFTPVNPGDFIEGEFAGIEKKEGGKYGEIEKNSEGKKVRVSYQPTLVDPETGELTVLPSTKLLQDFFEDMEIGTFVRITFNGKKLKKDKKKGDPNSEYNDYILEREVGSEKKKVKKK